MATEVLLREDMEDRLRGNPVATVEGVLLKAPLPMSFLWPTLDGANRLPKLRMGHLLNNLPLRNQLGKREKSLWVRPHHNKILGMRFRLRLVPRLRRPQVMLGDRALEQQVNRTIGISRILKLVILRLRHLDLQ